MTVDGFGWLVGFSSTTIKSLFRTSSSFWLGTQVSGEDVCSVHQPQQTVNSRNHLFKLFTKIRESGEMAVSKIAFGGGVFVFAFIESWGWGVWFCFHRDSGFHW